MSARDQCERIIRDARHTVDELRAIGEAQHAERVARLIRSRIGAKAENSRIHKAIRATVSAEVARSILQK